MNLDQILATLVPDDECLIWPRALVKGYGQVSYHGRVRGVHRVVYEELVGTIPDGLEIDHLCRRPACANVAHLEPVTTAENAARRAATVTHCPAGHEYTTANTYVAPGTRMRTCRTCKVARTRAWRAARRAA